MDGRFAERRRAVRGERRRARLRRTLIGATLVAIVIALAVIERGPLVALEWVEVVGTVRLDPAEVRTAAGLEEGTSIVRLRLGAARERVVALPLVRAADVSRTGVRSVRVLVEERQAVVEVRGGGVQRLVDREGVVIASGTDPTLTEVRLADAPPAVGGRASEVPALAAAMTVWRGVSGPVRADLERIEALVEDDVVLLLVDGTRVRLGRADRLDEKVRALGAILEDVGDVPVAVIDLRSPTAPVVVPR
ncbi:MAG: hypothetical protein RLZZ272_1440 [Actinomycetota bacterium]